MSTPRSRTRGWQIAPVDEPTPRRHEAILRRWVRCGERFDYAWVDIVPPLEPEESGISAALDHVLLAPRHEGFYLDQEPPEWPVHVYVLSAPDELIDSAEVPPDAVTIKLWALLIAPL